MTDQIVRLGPEYFPRATSGVPISGGSIYIGLPDTDPEIVGNQIQVSALQENGTTVPITQPVLTSGGGVPLYNGAPVTLLVPETYSLKVLDAFSVQVYYVPSTIVPVSSASSDVDSVKDLIGLINISAPVDDQTHIVLSFFDGLNQGGGGFYWDSTKDKATANGGTVVDPDNIGGFDGTTGTLSTYLSAQGGGVGFGCWLRSPVGVVHVEWFGAIPDDTTKKASNYIAIRSTMKAVIIARTDEPTPEHILGHNKITFGNGVFHVEGTSVFAFNRTELEAFNSSRFVSGMSWEGAGSKNTIIVLHNNGAESWLYDNRDSAYLEDDSAYDRVKFSGMTLRSGDYIPYSDTTRKYSVALTASINGFYFETYGWEKMFAFTDVDFEGFDRVFTIEGDGNGDQHTWMQCRFTGIVEHIWHFNNNQSVANRVFGCDAETYGNVISIGENGGGNITWTGGSVIQYPKYDTDNLPDSTLSAGNPRGFVRANLASISTGPSLGYSNGLCSFRGLRFENYDDYNHLVFTSRTDIVAYGRAIAKFTDCSFLVEMQYADDATSPTPKTGDRNLVYALRQSTDVSFLRCALAKNQKFLCEDVGGTGAESASCNISLDECNLGWIPADGLTLKGKFVEGVTSSDYVNFNRSARNCIPQSVLGADQTVSEDFNVTNARDGEATNPIKFAHMKLKDKVWPSGGSTGNRLYLPEGSMVTSVIVNKNAFGIGGSASYQVKLISSSSVELWASAAFQEEDAFVVKDDLTTPHIIPDVPNNYLDMYGANGIIDKGTGGFFLAGYF